MLHVKIAALTFMVNMLIATTQSQAVPGAFVETQAWAAGAGLVRKVEYQRHYYRHHGAHEWRRYYREVPPPQPVRPLSCGEFRFWDGTRCVDVRFR